MLKKILSIFFILCLVFSLTVPCFAEVNYISNVADPWTQYFSGSHYLYNRNLTTQFCNFEFQDDHVYYLRYNYISGEVSSGSFSFYIFINTTNGFEGVPTSSITGSYDQVYSNLSNTGGYTGFNIRNSSDLLFDFVILDITGLYESVPDLATVRSDLSFFVGSKNETQVNNTVSNPFVTFFSHIFEPFQYITEIGQTGYFFQPLILIGAVVGLLVFIFVCVFLIKRFTGGKT